MSDPRPIHRLFGMVWAAHCEGTDIAVETELDLSVKSQFVDMILTWPGEKPLAIRLPDGFDNLGRVNVVTFKSLREALDGFAMCELIGHFVNHRKQSSHSFDHLRPESDYRLYAVCARYPKNLKAAIRLKPLSPGVYEHRVLGHAIRIIVANRLPLEEKNAMLHLFASSVDVIQFGREHCRLKSREFSTLLYEMLQARLEEVAMSEKHKEQLRQMVEESLAKLPLEVRLKGIPAEDRLKGIPAEELARALSQADVLNSLPYEMRAKLAAQLQQRGQPPKPE